MNIGEMQRLLSVKAEGSKSHRFDDLYALVARIDWLRLAHDHVARNVGSRTAGCDGLDMKAFDENLEGNLLQLQSDLQSGTFEPYPVRRVYIPKSNGTMRPLGIPSVRDRIVQEAVRMVLEPIYEADFSQYSFGFRPNRCTMDAIKCILYSTTERKKFFWVVEGDISAYFDTINHKKLMKLLRRRIADQKLLDLIWVFLRAGVMERKLFKETKLGTPQGGIISPLLANVYLHELDRFMGPRSFGVSLKDKRRNRSKGRGNYVYIRYADDFVILSNGSRADAVEIRQEVHNFLRDYLRLTLSMEKTKVTHLNDGFDFLGFHLRRSMGGKKMGVKTLISDKGYQKHLGYLKAALAPTTTGDAIVAKITALNKAIPGWCRYYQYTSKASTQFRKLEHEAFWLLAHWLCKKHKTTMPTCLKRFYQKGNSLGIGQLRLVKHSDFPSLTYAKRIFKPNPYTTLTALEREALPREELPESSFWTGAEERPGWSDIRLAALKRDGYRCRLCQALLTSGTAQVDHIRPVRRFKRPVNANFLENTQTFCTACHDKKTALDRQAESRVR
jgi:RNA-directed DNA polymerase